MRQLLVAGLILLGSCSSKPSTSSDILEATTAPTTITKQFENQIAESILEEVRESLPDLKGATRVQFLREKSEQFNHSVNNKLLISRVLIEKDILDYLITSEDILLRSDSYASILGALSSLDWKPDTYERKILEELNRIDQTIAVLSAKPNTESFDQHAHMSEIRKSTRYPEDTFDGRQTYLDRLSQEMITAQADWFDTYSIYNPSELSILGEEGTVRSFHYTSDGLVINLGQVRDLPSFELKSLAVFYGFPGLQSFIPRTSDTLRGFLNLPAYTLGWAGYILDEIGIRDVGNTPDYLYFSRLQASMALADLKLHSDEWSVDEAVNYITDNTPYTAHRITLMIDQIQKNPGYYTAALGGKLKFVELKRRCLAEGRNCEADFNQQVIDQGPIPFEILERFIL